MLTSELKIAVIGAGKIANSLAAAINTAGFQIVSVISKNKKSASQLARKVKAQNFSDQLKDVSSTANFFIISVPDNQIKKTADEISKLNLEFPGKYFFHLSGVETINALESIRLKGGNIASLHIMQTFPSKKIININGCHAAVETADKNKRLLFSFSKKIGLLPFKINSNKKVFYHLAGIYTSNFISGNFFLAEQLFEKAGDKKTFYRVMNSISKTALSNILKFGAVNSLSGPVERGDKQTVKKHLDALDEMIKNSEQKKEMRMIKQNYVVQTINLLALIKRRDGKLSAHHSAMKKMLLKNLSDL